LGEEDEAATTGASTASVYSLEKKYIAREPPGESTGVKNNVFMKLPNPPSINTSNKLDIKNDAPSIVIK
jgi:hypothetical protein